MRLVCCDVLLVFTSSAIGNVPDKLSDLLCSDLSGAATKVQGLADEEGLFLGF